MHIVFEAAGDGKLDKDNRWFVEPQKQVSVWWQVFAYFIITIAEILISVTGLELAYTAAPKSMSGFVTACWLATVGLANLFINAPGYPAVYIDAADGLFRDVGRGNGSCRGGFLLLGRSIQPACRAQEAKI